MRNLGGPDFTSVNGFSTDQQGHFTFRGLAPGDYHLAIRPRISRPFPIMVAGRQLPDMPEFANVDLHVDSDIADLVITTRPTMTIAGRVIFEDGLPAAAPGAPDPLRALRISTSLPPGMGVLGPPANAQVAPDLTFSLKGLSSAAVVRVTGLPQNFVVKQVTVGAEDITDRPHDFVDRDSGQLQIVLTSRVAGLEGSVTGTGGQPAVDSVVVVIVPPDSGRHGAVYRTTTVDPHGRFRLQGLRSGTFAIVAIPRDRLPRPNDPDAVDALAKDAQPVTLADGEFKVIDLKVSGGNQ